MSELRERLCLRKLPSLQLAHEVGGKSLQVQDGLVALVKTSFVLARQLHALRLEVIRPTPTGQAEAQSTCDDLGRDAVDDELVQLASYRE